MALRCLIVDDSPTFLQEARELLEEDGISVVGIARSCEEATRRARELRPDVALVDIDVGGESGFAVVRRLAGQGGPVRNVILISSHAEEEFAELIEVSPALGFLAKAELGAEAIEGLLDAGRQRELD
jgi:DNA-binding NarL/FixJ family response regulator